MNLIEGKMLTIFTKPEKPKKKDQKGKEAKRVRLGIRLIFDDGVKVQVGDETYVGRGTMVFYHNRYQTIKVHAPMRPTYYRSGSVIMGADGPVWEEGENASKKTGGLTIDEFIKQHGAWGEKIAEMIARIKDESDQAMAA